MPVFQYRVIQVDFFHDRPGFAAALKAALDAEGAAPGRWELVQVIVHPNYTATVIFKK